MGDLFPSFLCLCVYSKSRASLSRVPDLSHPLAFSKLKVSAHLKGKSVLAGPLNFLLLFYTNPGLFNRH